MNKIDLGQTIRILASTGVVAIFVTMAACSEPTREEVLSRFPSGEKQVVAVYRGSGSSEALIERQTYDPTGRLVLLENLKDGTTQTFAELNPEIRTASGLAAFLSGEWHEHKRTSISRTLDYIDHLAFTFSEPTLDIAYSFIDVADDEESNEEDSFPIQYLNDLRFSIEYEDELEADLPQPTSTIVKIEIIDPQTIMLRDYEVYEGEIEVPSSSINRLHRSEEASVAEQLTWAEEYNEILEQLSNERRTIINANFPEWGASLDADSAQRFAESDRREAAILDTTNYRRSRSEDLVEFLDQMGMSFEDYRQHASMSAEEFSDIYLFADDGSIPPETSWDYVESTDPITSNIFRRAQVTTAQGSFWIYRDGSNYVAGLRPERGVSFGAEQFTMRVDENAAFSVNVLDRNDNGNTFVRLSADQVRQIESGIELLIQYDGLGGTTLVRFPLDGTAAAIAQLD